GHSTPLVRVLSLRDGTESIVLERAGSIHVMSRVALSPVGGRVALVSCIDRGGYEFTPWELDVIKLGDRSITRVQGEIAQHRPLWFPDGRHLAFVEWNPTTRTSAVSVLDVTTGDRRVVSEEWIRSISSDGSSVLVGSAEALRRIEISDGNELAIG